ncbi:MAG: hypothetical protein JWO38_1129 [Gemmataceae bacterium]|nr:hypothetical protein [Gemmataceae bacterium]
MVVPIPTDLAAGQDSGAADHDERIKNDRLDPDDPVEGRPPGPQALNHDHGRDDQEAEQQAPREGFPPAGGPGPETPASHPFSVRERAVGYLPVEGTTIPFSGRLDPPVRGRNPPVPYTENMNTETRPAPISFNAKRQFQAMLDMGWQRSGPESCLLHHPDDYDLMVQFDPVTDTLRMSPSLARALDLIIPTPAGRSKNFWRQSRSVATLHVPIA